ncbi:phage head-tail connector protein [Pediococcus acidilactici]|uniref:phage head-tail connector protein n=1 Tax=Pediococcus acidilactici TaxID=1254 RepID=UPI00159C811A|nr:phage head-tail connector protein [Pediococcus acidilactici]NVM32537.1 phage head-tail connector protein [Pediococcus acidilactici]
MDNLKNLKVLIAMDEDDTSKDGLLNLIIANTEASLKVKLHKKAIEKVPDELNYILLEVAVRRFNRLKNEGMANYSQEGETITFNSNDFDDFKDDIANWLADEEDKPTSLGKVSFISGYSGR